MSVPRKTINQITSIDPNLSANGEFVVEQGGETFKTSVSAIATYFGTATGVQGSGINNCINDSNYSGIFAGDGNTMPYNTSCSFIGAGKTNTIQQSASFTGAGCSNMISAADINHRFSSIIAGSGNEVFADNSHIIGGTDNLVSENAHCSFIIGNQLSSYSPNYTYVNNLTAAGIIDAVDILSGGVNIVDELAGTLQATTDRGNTTTQSISVQGIDGTGYMQLNKGLTAANELFAIDNDTVIPTQGGIGVGIGTKNPTGILHLSAHKPTVNVESSTNSFGTIQFLNDSTSRGEIVYDTEYNCMSFGASTGRTQLTILSSNHVGINKENPMQALDVTGTIRATETLSANALSANIGEVASLSSQTLTAGDNTFVANASGIKVITDKTPITSDMAVISAPGRAIVRIDGGPKGILSNEATLKLAMTGATLGQFTAAIDPNTGIRGSRYGDVVIKANKSGSIIFGDNTLDYLGQPSVANAYLLSGADGFYARGPLSANGGPLSANPSLIRGGLNVFGSLSTTDLSSFSNGNIVFGTTSNNVQQTSAGAVFGGSNNIVKKFGNAGVCGHGISYGQILGGDSNKVCTGHGTILGGINNVVSASNDPQNTLGFIGQGCENKVQTKGGVVVGGCNNVIKGTGQFSFIGAGEGNDICDSFGSVLGGGCSNTITSSTTAKPHYSFIGGGCFNANTDSSHGTIGGGYNHTLSASNCGGIFTGKCNSVCESTYGTIAGGYRNEIGFGGTSFIGAGKDNFVCCDRTVVVGGSGNKVYDDNGFIGGGSRNTVADNGSTIVASFSSTIHSKNSFVGGGSCHLIGGVGAETQYATIAGGHCNRILSGANGFIGGGVSNLFYRTACNPVGGKWSVIVGGSGNRVSNSYATIVGGLSNKVEGSKGFIGGGSQNVIKTQGADNGASNSAIVGGLCNRICKGPNNDDNTGNRNFKSFIGAGERNIIDGGDASVIVGGFCNRTQGAKSVVVAGSQNTILSGCAGDGARSFIGSGNRNMLLSGADCSFIGAGQCNTITLQQHSVIAGGQCNTITQGVSTVSSAKTSTGALSAGTSFIGAGSANFNASSCGSFIGAGHGNCIDACTNSFIGAGKFNTILYCDRSAIVAGICNTISGDDNFIGAGSRNCISTGSRHSSIVGAFSSCIQSAAGSFIGAGFENKLLSAYSFIGSGCNNRILSGSGDPTPADCHVANNIVGGMNNVIYGNSNSSIVGGLNQTLSAKQGVILGGNANTVGATTQSGQPLLSGTGGAHGRNSTIAGGFSSIVTGNEAFIANGRCNKVTGGQSFIGTGTTNKVDGNCSSIVAGTSGTVLNGNAFLGAGRRNYLSAGSAFMGAGQDNCARGFASALVAGVSSETTGQRSFVGAGFRLSAFADDSAVVGGRANCITANRSFIGGGTSNCVTGAQGAVVGGCCNCVLTNNHSFVGAGDRNRVSASCASIAGGCNNCVDTAACESTIGGGAANCVASEQSTIAGGYANCINNNDMHFIGGGGLNKILNGIVGGSYNTIAGGYNNTIQTDRGRNAVGGGCSNDITSCAEGSVIAGGCNNWICGGSGNGGLFGTVAGGSNNRMHQRFGTIGGGHCNRICMDGGTFSCTISGSLIAGGTCNNILSAGQGNVITGGSCNWIENTAAIFSYIGGGSANCIRGRNSSILGGVENCVRNIHTNSHIIGSQTTTVSSDMLHIDSLKLDYDKIPTSDPGVRGVVYNSGGGLLAISNG